MPDARFVDVYDILIRHRMVKDEQENRLTQRAEDVWSEIHAFARNYLLEGSAHPIGVWWERQNRPPRPS